MRVLVCGGRDFDDRPFLNEALFDILVITCLSG